MQPQAIGMKEEPNDNQAVVLIFAQIYFFIKRYILVLIIFIVAGVTTGLLWGNSSKNYYKKHLVINSTVINNNITLEMVRSFNDLSDGKNISEVAEKLCIPENAALSIHKFDTASIHSKMNAGLIVDITINDSSFADTITNGLVTFLNENNFFKEKLKLFLKEKQIILASINRMLYSTDTSSNSSDKLKSNKSSEIIQLLNEKYEIEKEIKSGSKINVIDESLVSIHTGINKIEAAVIYGIGFEVLGVFLLLFLSTVRSTHKYLKLQKK